MTTGSGGTTLNPPSSTAESKYDDTDGSVGGAFGCNVAADDSEGETPLAGVAFAGSAASSIVRSPNPLSPVESKYASDESVAVSPVESATLFGSCCDPCEEGENWLAEDGEIDDEGSLSPTFDPPVPFNGSSVNPIPSSPVGAWYCGWNVLICC